MYNSIQELPKSIKDVLPEAGQKLFIEVFNNSFERTGNESLSLRVAWDVIKRRFRKSGTQWVAMSRDFEAPKLYVFDLQTVEQSLIVNSIGDEIEIEAILADTTPRKGDGAWFTVEALEAIAEQINTRGSTLPDVEHAVMAALREQFIPNHRMPVELSKTKGMFNKIKAAVKDGKLWIRAWLDKRYEEIIQLYKFLSIEALAKQGSDGRLESPEYLGFTFTDNPRLPDAQIAGL